MSEFILRKNRDYPKLREWLWEKRSFGDKYKDLESLVSGWKEWGEMMEQKPENTAKGNTKTNSLVLSYYGIMEPHWKCS